VRINASSLNTLAALLSPAPTRPFDAVTLSLKPAQVRKTKGIGTPPRCVTLCYD
jgi:hypothetical protein